MRLSVFAISILFLGSCGSVEQPNLNGYWRPMANLKDDYPTTYLVDDSSITAIGGLYESRWFEGSMGLPDIRTWEFDAHVSGDFLLLGDSVKWQRIEYGIQDQIDDLSPHFRMKVVPPIVTDFSGLKWEDVPKHKVEFAHIGEDSEQVSCTIPGRIILLNDYFGTPEDIPNLLWSTSRSARERIFVVNADHSIPPAIVDSVGVMALRDIRPKNIYQTVIDTSGEELQVYLRHFLEKELVLRIRGRREISE